MTVGILTTAPQLLAAAYGLECSGSNRCFYCGSPCGSELPASRAVRDTFAAHATVYAGRVAHRQGEWFVCLGCAIAMKSDHAVTGYDKPQRWWTFSHIVTASKDRWLTKANLDELRDACLNPPATTYVIALADSGQKHQLYLTPINGVILETEAIQYAPSDLAARIELCSRIAVAAGKPSLDEPATVSLGISLSAYWSDWESVMDRWAYAHGHPITRLAAWLTPGKQTLLKDQRYA